MNDELRKAFIAQYRHLEAYKALHWDTWQACADYYEREVIPKRIQEDGSD